MFVDSVIIISVIVGCLAFFLLVAIFTAIFQRELGTKHVEKFDDAEDSEKERLTPIAVQDEAQVEYTTETVQPENKIPISGYPHAQVNMFSCYVRGLVNMYCCYVNKCSVGIKHKAFVYIKPFFG